MRRIAVAALGWLALAVPTEASNTAYKLTFTVISVPGKSSMNWLALPYRYFPSGNIGELPQNARHFCADLNGAAGDDSKIKLVARWNVVTEMFLTKTCKNSLAVFNLEPGIAYAVVPNGKTVTLDLWGSMDDDFAPNKGGTKRVPVVFAFGKSSTNWIAVPYNVNAVNAADLCAMVNGAPSSTAKVIAIDRWNVLSETFLAKVCKGTLSVFNVKAGEGLAFVPNGGVSTSIGFDVY